jgi:glycosyltransferase involved in cell wall biosynthesis
MPIEGDRRARRRIALLSKAFLPNVGGIETSTAMIATVWNRAGHDVEVVTAVPDDAPWSGPYRVTRAWNLRALGAAVEAADLVVTNGYSRLAIAVAGLRRRRIVVFHQGYQLICSDGLGFRNRKFHGFKRAADLKLAFAQSPNAGLRALAQLPFDTVIKAWPFGIDHVVPSHHVGRRLGLPGARVVYQPPNPVVIDALPTLEPLTPERRRHAYLTGDIVFFGRLVFEKGCDDLVRAYRLWLNRAGGDLGGRAAAPRLIIYGQGPEKALLERLVGELGLEGRVEMRAFLGGRDLAAAARAASVVVVPSRWEEPGATVAVELFACGGAVIASETGAQGEIFAEHGRVFRNDDAERLADALGQHFASGPVYPRPTGREEWELPMIERALLEIADRRDGVSAA